MNKLLREPLLHFLVLGAVIFVAYHLLPKSPAGSSNIVVTEGEVLSLVTGFTRTWQRPPSGDELQGLIREQVREQMATREAISLGLDKGDSVIQRRLRQKLEFLTDEIAEPTDEQLEEYLAHHSDLFRTDRTYSFTQVYLDDSLHGQNLGRDAARTLQKLRSAGIDADVSTEGDRLMIAADFSNEPAPEIAKQFGEKFAGQLAELPVGEWQGPITSGFGTHLVVVKARGDGHVPKLGEVRNAVVREWMNTERMAARERYYTGLQKRYTITIEAPQIAATVSKTADGRQ